ncbi:MAG TPA: hypothetical protein VMT57_09170 [Candidatus Thermoplasmatota archaeon]|nr:hypothetical protein [Candidatus Thermoplasmatota archaeon]
MNKYPLIEGSICAVVLLVLASLTNVVGYQTVQASNQKIIANEINEKDLLFQTIVDIANNKEIQRVILGSELTSKRFFDSNLKFSIFTYPVVTKRFLNFAYHFGLILAKTISKSKIQSMLKQHQVSNQGVLKEIKAFVEKDVSLKNEITQLSSLSCDCENENTSQWNFPIICLLLKPIAFVVAMLWYVIGIIFLLPIPNWLQFLFDTIKYIVNTLHCWT